MAAARLIPARLRPRRPRQRPQGDERARRRRLPRLQRLALATMKIASRRRTRKPGDPHISGRIDKLASRAVPGDHMPAGSVHRILPRIVRKSSFCLHRQVARPRLVVIRSYRSSVGASGSSGGQSLTGPHERHRGAPDGSGVLSGVPTGVPKLPASPRPISGVCVAKRSWGDGPPGRAGKNAKFSRQW